MSARTGAVVRGGGFTLIELLVAMLILAIMFAMGYAAISQGATGRQALNRGAAHGTGLHAGVPAPGAPGRGR